MYCFAVKYKTDAMKPTNQLILFSVLVFGLFSCKTSDTETPAPQPADTALSVSVLTENLTNPWELVWAPDSTLWMTERGGRISTVDPATGQLTPVITIADVQARGEGGLLGLALHPEFETTPQVFVAYNYDRSGVYTEKIVRYTFNGSTLTEPVTILDGITAGNIHNGCRLLITEDLKLFISTGDAGDQSLPQNPTSLSGKLLRVNLDGSIPADNPNPQSPVWSSGHRNAQGLVQANDKLYATEHGPNSDDEVNSIEKGLNYGWPDVRGLCDEPAERQFCEEFAVKEPIAKWTPTIAVCGLDYYKDGPIAQWRNSLLMATLKDGTLYQLQLNDAGTEVVQAKTYISEQYGRLRDVCVAANGNVYVCTGNGTNDKIIVLSADKSQL